MAKAHYLMAIFNSVFRFMTTVGACLVGSAAIAAEIRNDPSRMAAWGAVLEGTIEPGDFEKVRRFIFDGHGALEIYLASPGGDLSEAMKIGHLLRALKVTTVLPANFSRFQRLGTTFAKRGLSGMA